MPEVVYITYNTDTRALPDIYALALAPSGIVRTVYVYQAKHSCLCYKLYIACIICVHLHTYITIFFACSKVLLETKI